ncbi:NAD(P)-dependent oxidoreductase [Spongiactinospora gelatinilytica]|uniref:NAD(P)-dependent oxidoreductase n=1 Tax=Spongiactinospora gelatinilytica TaxID=2666298 RepID=A0A2W2H8Z9_9ACTN|nr:SDR family oxidoreductase [Spongiactinospora gelatinilytica]PZG51389.1 NAD(P)-dependent oxidoreductase [Spongiactinospora gelatinilytica]
MQKSTVLVVGATGGVGSLLLPALRERGARVRAMTRTAGRAAAFPDGVEPVVADLHDPGLPDTVFDGVDAVFLNSPSAPDAADIQIRFAERVRRAGVPRLVLLSQYAARAGSPVRFLRWHAAVELYVRTAGLTEWTILRPNLFMQGILAFAGMIKAQRTFAAPIGTAAVSAIDTRDIADAAAVVLTEPGHAGRTYTLTGPRAVTHPEIARALSDATGGRIGFTDVPPEVFAGSLRGLLPEWQADGLVEDYAHYARGEAAEIHTDVADLTGHPARDVTDFARDHAVAFKPSAG